MFFHVINITSSAIKYPLSNNDMLKGYLLYVLFHVQQ